MRITLILILGLSLISGCGEKSSEPIESGQTIPDMTQAYEDAEKLLDNYSVREIGEPIQGEPINPDITIPTLTNDKYDIYMVTFVWGWPFNIWAPPEGSTVWDGTLSVNGAAIVNIDRTIDFEPGQDSVLPHDAVHYAAWVSETEQDFDGFVAFVFLEKGITYITEPRLSFETGPFTISYSFSQLDDFTALYAVDNINAVAVRAVRIWTYECPRGTMDGIWVKDDNTGETGHFSGLWIEQSNDTLGYYSGQYWTTEDGRRLFNGSVSGYVTDQVIAEFSGHWMYDDPRLCPLCGTGHGLFWGGYQYLDREGSGTMKGVFGDYSFPPDDVEMPMNGFWRDDCDPRHTGGNSGIE